MESVAVAAAYDLAEVGVLKTAKNLNNILNVFKKELYCPNFTHAVLTNLMVK
jgi:hypothetical protein